jgi:hypothetical protein
MVSNPPRQVYLSDGQWAWLLTQPGGASSTLRAFVDKAMAATQPTSSGPTAAALAYATAAKAGHLRKRRAQMEAWLTGPIGLAFLRACLVSVPDFLAEFDRRRAAIAPETPPDGGAISASEPTPSTGPGARP